VPYALSASIFCGEHGPNIEDEAGQVRAEVKHEVEGFDERLSVSRR
jgi:hypothetical protein